MAPEEDIGRAVIGAAIKVHSVVGPGLLESAYEACLVYELERQRLRVKTQIAVPLRYEEIVVEQGYRFDLLVEDVVVASRPLRNLCDLCVELFCLMVHGWKTGD